MSGKGGAKQMQEAVGIDIDGRGVARLMLARPEQHNALSVGMMDELTAAAERLGSDPDVRVVVLSGAGESFCAGGDLGWMKAQRTADPAVRTREAHRLAAMLRALNNLPKPLIGRIQGQAFGGGLGLIAVCDVAVGVDTARFGLTEVRLGLIPATIGPYVVARIGEAMARRVFLSGRVFGAEEAVQFGFLARTVAPEMLDVAVEAEVAPCLAAAPGAVAAAKRLLRRLGPGIDEATIAESIEALSERWDSAEAQEGIDAFFARRKPSWSV